jgi:hypothetical protein
MHHIAQTAAKTSSYTFSRITAAGAATRHSPTPARPSSKPSQITPSRARYPWGRSVTRTLHLSPSRGNEDVIPATRSRPAAGQETRRGHSGFWTRAGESGKSPRAVERAGTGRGRPVPAHWPDRANASLLSREVMGHSWILPWNGRTVMPPCRPGLLLHDAQTLQNPRMPTSHVPRFTSRHATCYV